MANIISITPAPYGDKILTGTADGIIKEWEINSGSCIKVYKGHKGRVNSVQYSPDGKRIISGSEDKRIKEWDRESGKCIKTYKRYGSVHSVHYSPDGEYFVSGEDGGEVSEFYGGKMVKRYVGNYNSVRSALYCNNGKMIISAGDALWDYYDENYKDNELILWDRNTGEAVKRYGINPSVVLSLALSPDNKKVIFGSFDNDIYEVDLDNGNIKTYKGHKDGINCVSFSPDGSKIVSGSRDKTVKEWDTKTGECIATYGGYTEWINTVIYAGGKIIHIVNNTPVQLR